MSNNENTTVEVKCSLDIDFCNLPSESTQTQIEKDNKKIIAKYDRPYLKMIYGGKIDGKEIAKNETHIKNVEKFLKNLYETRIKDDDNDQTLSYDEWINKLAMQRACIMLMMRARNEAITTSKITTDDFISTAQKLESAGKMDENTVKQLEEMLARIKAANASTEKTA